MLWFVIACGAIALLYGIFASRAVLSASAGNERMQEIAGAIQEGASAYLNRQYRTIGIVGIVVAVILFFTLGGHAAEEDAHKAQPGRVEAPHARKPHDGLGRT